ncbi:MAG: helix-turn-helix transcriptional regulator [bacterium]
MKIKALPNAKEKVDVALAERKLSYTDLAKLISYSNEHISRVLNNKVTASNKFANEICKQLKLKFDDLFTREEELKKFNKNVMSDEELKVTIEALKQLREIYENIDDDTELIDDMLDELE